MTIVIRVDVIALALHLNTLISITIAVDIVNSITYLTMTSSAQGRDLAKSTSRLHRGSEKTQEMEVDVGKRRKRGVDARMKMDPIEEKELLVQNPNKKMPVDPPPRPEIWSGQDTIETMEEINERKEKFLEEHDKKWAAISEEGIDEDLKKLKIAGIGPKPCYVCNADHHVTEKENWGPLCKTCFRYMMVYLKVRKAKHATYWKCLAPECGKEQIPYAYMESKLARNNGGNYGICKVCARDMWKGLIMSTVFKKR